MKSLEERIEAGRSAYLASQEPQVTCFPSSGQIEAILRAAYPELHTDPPTAWLAPNELSDEVLYKCGNIQNPEYGRIITLPSHLRALFAAMREAHLHPEKSP